MIKVCYALRIIGAILSVGAMGSLQLDVIDFWDMVLSNHARCYIMDFSWILVRRYPRIGKRKSPLVKS